MQTSTDDDTTDDHCEAYVHFGTVRVFVTASAVTFVLAQDYYQFDYELAQHMASCWPHESDTHSVLYLADGSDALIFLRK